MATKSPAEYSGTSTMASLNRAASSRAESCIRPQDPRQGALNFREQLLWTRLHWDFQHLMDLRRTSRDLYQPASYRHEEEEGHQVAEDQEAIHLEGRLTRFRASSGLRLRLHHPEAASTLDHPSYHPDCTTHLDRSTRTRVRYRV